MARVLYCSATGVSDVKQMRYANRLNLWGPSTAYPKFSHFEDMLNKRGIGGLEMLSLEMKMQGRFIARSLSWEGALFETCEFKLSGELEGAYNVACGWWHDTRVKLKSAIATLGPANVTKFIWRVYWSSLQRFFKEFNVCAKVKYVCDQAKKDIAAGRSVVIGLQSTGEQSTKDFMDLSLVDLQAEKNLPANAPLTYDMITFDNLVSTLVGTARAFISNHFPVQPTRGEIPPIPSLPPSPTDEDMARYRIEMSARQNAINAANAPPDETLVELRAQLLLKLQKLTLPPNPLDELVDKLGGENAVAEMTGRVGRIVREPGLTSFKYKKRAGTAASSTKGLSSFKGEVEMDMLNIEERKRFQDGEKYVAIISDAASTGISLHANAGSKNSGRRRVHYTIELPWAADKAIQQLGRSHRAGQLSAPIYRNVITNMGGERR